MVSGTLVRVALAVVAALAVHGAIVVLRRWLAHRLARGSVPRPDRDTDALTGIAEVVADAVGAAGGDGWVALHVALIRAGRRPDRATMVVRAGEADPAVHRVRVPARGDADGLSPDGATDEVVEVLARVVPPPGRYDAEPVPALVVRELGARLAPRLAPGTVVELTLGTADGGTGPAGRCATLLSVVVADRGVLRAAATHRPCAGPAQPTAAGTR